MVPMKLTWIPDQLMEEMELPMTAVQLIIMNLFLFIEKLLISARALTSPEKLKHQHMIS